MFEKILELIYPTTCGICEEINKEGLCQNCELKLKEYEINKISYVKKQNFDVLINILEYKNLVRDKMIQYKFGDKAYLYKFFSKIILKNEKICRILKKYDIIIPVPIHKKKKSTRGYNQSYLIARELAKNIDNLQLEADILHKVVNTQSQSLLTKAEREKSIIGAFEVKNKEKIIDKKIILLDDIYTTGSTANECSKVLKQNGASEILVLTIAKD
jgi:ComF family protein